MAISQAMFQPPIGNVPFGTSASGGPENSPGRAGRWFTRPSRSTDQQVDTVQADAGRGQGRDTLESELERDAGRSGSVDVMLYPRTGIAITSPLGSRGLVEPGIGGKRAIVSVSANNQG